MTTFTYYFRGQVERSRKKNGKMTYRWSPGYSEQGEHAPLQPWMTRAECYADAKARGGKAYFDMTPSTKESG